MQFIVSLTNIYLTLSLALDINLCGTNCPSLVAKSISNLLACAFTGQEFGGGSGISDLITRHSPGSSLL